MIESLELKNLTVFDKLKIELSPGINVIIGKNGTGKTHLLKAAYGLCDGAQLFRNKPDINDKELEKELTAKLLSLFMPLDGKLGKMHRQGATSIDNLLDCESQAYLSAKFAGGQRIAVNFFNNSKTLAIKDRTNYEQYQAKAVFIPTKEVLSFMKGFNSLYQKYNLSFDQTYQDICLLLDLPKIRPEILHEKSKWAMTEIENICGGHFVFHGGGIVTFKTEDAEYSANSIAEGFRKLGMLLRLLETGAIQPGVSGPLFWENPESNLNPELMKLLVQILLELARNGQQVILTTYDYMLIKWFYLLTDKSKNDHVRFHSLSNIGRRIQSVDDYHYLNNDFIVDVFSDLYDTEIKRPLDY